MKTNLIKKNSRLIACLAFSLSLSPIAHAKQTVLNPLDGVTLQDIMVEIRSYRTCMDKAQNTAKRGRAAYNKAQSQQCYTAFVGLEQLMDKQSLKRIDNLSWLRWHKQAVGTGFSVERILKNPTALISGVVK